MNKSGDKAALWRHFGDNIDQYDVRTKHFDEQGQPRFINDLIKESSPYLLQHAHNPVNWMSWGDAAFVRAEKENKPIFLSIGYATCHWCHVMEHESFENIEVAEYLNQHFVCIKVDREQHPVVDDYHMTALQLISGHGGWPLSAFANVNGQPFMAGTYYPQADFLALLQRIVQLWNTQHAVITEQSVRIHQTVCRYLSGGQSDGMLDWESQTQQLSDELMAMADARNGGFSGAPKFPQEAWLQFLLYRYLDTQDETLGRHLCLSLKSMQTSGIHDVVAGGFHRYTVDEGWMVPHFEKMLYNQAQLLLLYAQAAVVFDKASFADTARSIVRFVDNEMLGDTGLFFAGLDADSNNEQGESEEGAYYTWDWDEWVGVLTESELQFLQRHFDVHPEGNLEGKNILHGIDVDESNKDWAVIKKKLISARKDKKRPITDHKAIMSWNAMMIESLAWAGHLLDDDGMKKMALNALEGLIKVHQQLGQWQRISVNGKTSNVPAVLSDLTNLASAMWAVHATGLKHMSEELGELLGLIQKQFWYDGQLLQAQSSEYLPSMVNAKDGATVSATAKLLSVLSALNDDHWQTWHSQILNSLHASVGRQNTAHAGVFTAQLQQKNHMLGQNLLAKKGLVMAWKNHVVGHGLSLQTLSAWTHKDISITTAQGTLHKVTELPFRIELDAQTFWVDVEWLPCDDKQCYAPQETRLWLV